MANVLLVNASAPAYNLGLAKAAAWWSSQGATIRETQPPITLLDWRDGVDVAFVSAIFSWHVDSAIYTAQTLRSFGASVKVGGPGLFGLRDYARSAGFAAQAVPDPRFEEQPGRFPAVFWSRGCPAYNCHLGYPRDGRPALCIVPEMEGSRFTLYHEAEAAPIILDNNLSALPRRFQEHIVEKTLAAGFRKVDANSGFEPHSFRPETAELWKRLPLVAWRFAFDQVEEWKEVLRMIEILDSIGVKRRNLHVYCIAGNEPFDACYWRVALLRSWKCIPVVQMRTPLDYTGGPIPTIHDWTERKLRDFKRWSNWLSHSIPWEKYNPRLNHSGVKLRERV